VNSVLSPGVRVDVGAVVRDSIVMFDSVIRSGAVVDRAILDKEVVVGQGAIVGDGPYDDRPNKQEPGRLNTGITVIGKRAVVPRGVRIGRNVKIAADVRSSDFAGRVVRSGESVEPRRQRRATTAAEAVAPDTKTAQAAAAVGASPERAVVGAVVGASGGRGKRTNGNA
jgi:glucose-1-phosphate adenylyltransferase